MQWVTVTEDCKNKAYGHEIAVSTLCSWRHELQRRIYINHLSLCLQYSTRLSDYFNLCTNLNSYMFVYSYMYSCMRAVQETQLELQSSLTLVQFNMLNTTSLIANPSSAAIAIWRGCPSLTITPMLVPLSRNALIWFDDASVQNSTREYGSITKSNGFTSESKFWMKTDACNSHNLNAVRYWRTVQSCAHHNGNSRKIRTCPTSVHSFIQKWSLIF